MKNVGENIRKHLQKNLEALHRFEARKTTFMTAREQITREIEEARSIWLETLEQLPHQEFSKKKEISYFSKMPNNGLKFYFATSLLATSLPYLCTM